MVVFIWFHEWAHARLISESSLCEQLSCFTSGRMHTSLKWNGAWWRTPGQTWKSELHQPFCLNLPVESMSGVFLFQQTSQKCYSLLGRQLADGLWDLQIEQNRRYSYARPTSAPCGTPPERSAHGPKCWAVCFWAMKKECASPVFCMKATKALFRSIFFLNFNTVVLSFLFDKHYTIIE